MAPPSVLTTGTVTDSSNGSDADSQFQDERASSIDGTPAFDDSSQHEHSTTSFKSSTHRSGQSGNHSSEESSSLAKAETRAVNRSKLLVLFVLFCAAAAIGVATYIYSHDTEQQEFESRFHDFAIEIEELVHHEARNVFLTVQTYSTTITSYALSTKATFPYVSLPHFEVRGTEINELSNSVLLAYAPYVSSELGLFRWGLYSNYMQKWIQEGVDYNYDLHKDYLNGSHDIEPIFPEAWKYASETNRTRVPVTEGERVMPLWQIAPAPHDPTVVNYNLLENEVFRRIDHGMHSINQPVLSEATDLAWLYNGSVYDDPTHPHSFLMQPVYHDFVNHSEADILGVVVSVIGWDHYFENLLPPEAHGICVVMKDTCGDEFSYQINGAEAIFLGYGDHHETKFTHLEEFSPFDVLHKVEASDLHDHCEYEMHIYPMQELQDDYLTTKPILYTVVVLMVFLGTVLVFVLYDYLVTVRQRKVALAAKKSNAVVRSLFPKNVRDRLMQDVEAQLAGGQKPGRKSLMFGAVAKHELKHFLDDDQGGNGVAVFDTKPIADLFPSTTIMFGDIVGFTAWSSVREPSQVFSLLETLYHAFDEIAKRRRVFKVETIGDCYVAVSGLPEPRKDHATVMARFARDCLQAMNDLTKRLEVTLGPDTGDLSMRVGLHSGPVTAGVLRGDKSRFQLFGDTVNTAARIESNGQRNRIHISQETADLLKMGGKHNWIKERSDKIVAKGKGELTTYWLELKQQSCGSQRSGQSGKSTESDSNHVEMATAALSSLAAKDKDAPEVHIDPVLPAKIKRLVKWNADVLLRILRQVVARREALESLKMNNSHGSLDSSSNRDDEVRRRSVTGKTVIDEVIEIIELPKFNGKAAKIEKDAKEIEIPQKVVQQLHDYLTVIASMYRSDVPFHNFDHASHVTMSVVKLLSRIVAPDEVLMEADQDEQNDHDIRQNLHDHTFGITSDPLTQFAVVLSALIHDVDHTGAPNAQLIKEGANIAAVYRGKSVAEQNSVDLAWSLLMDPAFTDLRSMIYKTEDERKRFRQLVVNVVLATDIVDKDLKNLRNARWEKAFKQQDGVSSLVEKSSADSNNRKATIILEHLIQASDIAHTMQHWHIYRKWNELFFMENLLAYRSGRAEKDPSEYWYKGEIGFFDFYIIPLAHKLKECGVFGVSCDEYLQYAENNRKEWVRRGEDVVAEMVEKYKDLLPEEDKEIHPIEEEYY